MAYSLAKHKFPKKKEEVERVNGIEPSQLAWKARALPLSYTRVKKSRKVLNLPEESSIITN